MSNACDKLGHVRQLCCHPTLRACSGCHQSTQESELNCKHGRRDVQVGGEMPGGLSVRGLSGGEKRRLRIACALIAEPSVIYLVMPALDYLQLGACGACSKHC